MNKHRRVLACINPHALEYQERIQPELVAQMFYVGTQIMCWTFIIQYAENLGMSKSTAQNYNIIAMSIFLTSRLIWLLVCMAIGLL